MSLADYVLQAGGTRLREDANQIYATCPFHNEERPSWGISKTPPHPYGCFACGARGTLRTLLTKKLAFTKEEADLVVPAESQGSDMFILPVERLPDGECLKYGLSTKALKYLKTRGVTRRTAKTLELAYDPDADRLLFPWFVKDTYHGMTGRTLNPKEKAKTIPYDGLRKNTLYLPSRCFAERMILVEGEMDAVRIWQDACEDVAALGAGVLSAGQLSQLVAHGVRTVVLAMDNDAAGRRIEWQTSVKLSARPISVEKVEWPTAHLDKDPADLSAAELKELFLRRTNATLDVFSH